MSTLISEFWVLQRVNGDLGNVLGSAQRAVLSWLSSTQVGPVGGFVEEEAFGIQGLISEMELFLLGLGQIGS